VVNPSRKRHVRIDRQRLTARRSQERIWCEKLYVAHGVEEHVKSVDPFKRIFGGLGSSENLSPATAFAIPEESRPAATSSEGFLTVKSPRFMARAEAGD